MFRTMIAFATLALFATPALAQSCDFNSDSAAVVAAWGSKVRDASMPQDQLDAISRQIQQLPSIQATDPGQACNVLANLKAQLGI
jgi:hypothetical protein